MKTVSGSGLPMAPREFNSGEEIDLGIEKLRRRIEDVKSLNSIGAKYDDAKVASVESRIRETILEVFGKSSRQYKENAYYAIWHGGYRGGDSQDERQHKFIKGIPQAISMLEGLIEWLSEKKSDLVSDGRHKSMTLFDDLQLHPRIIGVSAQLYKDGHYPNAVFDASKALVNFVKEKSRRHDLDGASLMRTVFSRQAPILAFNELSEASDQDEQEGMMHLFEGAVLALRNPRGHTFLSDSPERALEYIAFLSMLANRLEETRFSGPSTP